MALKKAWMVMMMLMLGEWWCDACWKRERIALLRIKDSFINYTNIASRKVSDWGEDDDCCHWDGIECNITTWRVNAIELSYPVVMVREATDLSRYSEWDRGLGDMYLNASLFVPFEELNSLRLGRNNIVGWIEKEGLERLSQLANLEYLDLSYNKFNNCILSSLPHLSSLKNLYLHHNALNGYANIGGLNNLTSLRWLDLRDNVVEGFKSSNGLERLSIPANLEYLGLSYNSFDNSILSFLPHLSFLKDLDLRGNKLNGSINIGGLNNLTSLRWFDLGDNAIEGFKSTNGLMLKNLQSLYLDGNRFDNVVLSSLKGLSSLEKLDLGNNQLREAIDMKDLDGLRNLEWLDLSGNEINKFMFSKDITSLRNLSTIYLNNVTTNGGSIRIESLGYIQSLDLCDNILEGSIFGEELHNMSTLKELYLGTDYNVAVGTYFSMDENSLRSIGSLTSLEVLQMNNVKSISPIEGFPNLKNLEALDISYSTLSSNFLQSIPKWAPSLRRVWLFGCGINGTIAKVEGLCELRHLQVLHMRSNHLSGILPWCLANLTSLQELDLSDNQLKGSLHLSPLGSLTSLQYLSLSSNLFKIPISFSPFFNLSKLTFLVASNNEICVEIESPNLTPKFQLVDLYFSNNGDIGVLPNFLYHQVDLQYVDLSNNRVKGGFPNWLLDNNTRLTELVLVNNSLYGPFQLPTQPHNLSSLDVSTNCLDGPIPKNIGAYFQLLTFLSMSNNCLNGGIPSSFSIISDLQLLDLSNNNLSGSFEFRFSQSLSYVYLSKNKLTGTLKNVFFDCKDLIVLDLSHNSLTGVIPNWITRFLFLKFLLLRYNNFEGEITTQFCKLNELRWIDLSHNNLSGQIPHCLTFGGLGVSFNGPFPLPIKATFNSAFPEPLEFTTKSILYFYGYRILPYFFGLDLSCNNFEGEIPLEIGDLNQIQVLNLSHNHLSGPIPQTFFNLSQVESLDISNNRLNGTIPYQLTQLHALAFFSIAHNNLSGKTPEMIAQFATFNESSYEGNPLLCGLPLSRSCDAVVPPLSAPRPPNNDEEDGGFIDMRDFYTSFLVAYVMVLFTIAAVLYINPYWRHAWLYYIEVGINNCFYTFLDNFSMPFKFRDS